MGDQDQTQSNSGVAGAAREVRQRRPTEKEAMHCTLFSLLMTVADSFPNW